MDYIPLTLLDNQYPSAVNYTKYGDDKVVLAGKYPANSLTFKQPKLNTIIPVSDNPLRSGPLFETTFRFILKIDSKYYTSKTYWDDLQKSIVDNNPYFTQESVKNYNIVEVNTTGMSELFATLKEKESAVFVDMIENVYVKPTEIDYVKLVQYIDWLTSPFDPDLIENGGVKYWYDLCEYATTKQVVVNGDIIPIEVTINNVSDNSLEGIVYWSKCEEKWVWPFENLNKPTQYKWINGESVSITNNTNDPITVKVALTGVAEISKVFKLDRTTIKINANSTQDLRLLTINRFEIDKVWPKVLWNGTDGQPGDENHYDHEYIGELTLSSTAITTPVTTKIRLRKQSGGKWNDSNARIHQK